MRDQSIVIIGVIFQGTVLCVHRASTDPVAPDYWEFPGGKVEGGESLFQAATRELKEETGIETLDLKYLCILKNKINNQDKLLHLFVLQLDYQPKIRLNPREHQSFKWVSLCQTEFDVCWFENVVVGVQKINEWRKVNANTT